MQFTPRPLKMAEHHDINDAPPSYDEVISSPDALPQVQPANPGTHTSSIEEARFFDTNQTVTRGTLPPPISSSSTLPVDNTDSSSDALNCIQHFTSFNSIRHMTRHWGSVAVQSDLDVEHHIPSSRAAHNANQAAYGRTYCYRILLILLSVMLIGIAIVLPVVMVLAGALQFDECPFNNRALILCSLIGGIALGLLTCLRFTICCVFFLGNDNDKRANSCGGCLCCLEMGFTLLAIGYLATLGVAAYLVFNSTPDRDCPVNNPDCDEYCDRNVYWLLSVLIWIQLSLLVLFIVTFIVLLLGVRWCCCVRPSTVRIS